jgi:hypothetical protein
MFAVRSDIPLPPRSMSRGRPRLYPLADMEVGDSFVIPVTAPDTLDNVAWRANYAVGNYGRKTGRAARFSVRRLGDHVGVWRTA